MNIVTDIRVAVEEHDLEEIFRFRYRIYVEEMNRKQVYADHRARRIEDPLDVGAINVGAWRSNVLVGVVRINLPCDSDIGSYETFYQMRSVGHDHPSRTSIITRLMVDPNYRNTRLFLDLVSACSAIGRTNGTRWTFIDCNRHLVPLFLRLGYLAHTPPAFHKEYGLVTLLRIDMHDVQHLKRVGSPFFRMIKTSPAASGISTSQVPSLR